MQPRFFYLVLSLLLTSVFCQVSLNETTVCQMDISNMTGSLPSYPNTLLMQDSSGKGSFGVFIAFKNLIDPGKWDECNRIGDTANYCLLESSFGIPGTDYALPTVLGICIPSTCSSKEIEEFPYAELVNALDLPSLGKILDTQRDLTVLCREKEAMSTGTKVFYGFLGTLLLFVLLGTLLDATIASRVLKSFINREPYDLHSAEPPTIEQSDISSNYTYFTEDEATVLLEKSLSRVIVSPIEEESLIVQAARSKPSAVVEILSYATFSPSKSQILYCLVIQFLGCWSCIRNFKLLFHYNNEVTQERFRFLHGIKVCASLWTILGYTIFYISLFGWINVERLPETEHTFSYQLYYNSSVYAADIFWICSGLLVTYYSVILMKRPVIGQENVLGEYHQFINVPVYIIRRILRFWPSLIIAVFFFWYGSPILGDGPFWPWYSDFVQGECSGYWWSPTFFVTSLYPTFSFDQLDPLHGCFSWAWYISIQLFCFMVTPILIFLFYKRRAFGIGATIILISASILCGILVCSIENLSVGIGPQTDSEHGDYFNLYYSKPYTRAHSYFLGVLIAFLLHMKMDMKVSLLARIVIYAFIWPLFFSLFFITYNIWNHGGWSDVENVLFASLQHPVFSICFAISVYLMSLGYNGPFNLRSFFSHPFWLPFSRLSYGVYLYAPIVILVAGFSIQTSLAYTDLFIVFEFFVFTILTYAGSLLQFLLIEKPIRNCSEFFIDLSFVIASKLKAPR